MTERPLIITTKMDEAAQKFFNKKRKLFFPSARNFLDAHITLFHALPGRELKTLRDQLQLQQSNFPIEIDVAGLQLTGNGFAYKLASRELSRMQWRRRLGKRSTANASWKTNKGRNEKIGAGDPTDLLLP